jgi:hypothetical protein
MWGYQATVSGGVSGQVLTVVDLADGGVVHDADDGVTEMPRPLVADGAVVGLVPGCSAW